MTARPGLPSASLLERADAYGVIVAKGVRGRLDAFGLPRSVIRDPHAVVLVDGGPVCAMAETEDSWSATPPGMVLRLPWPAAWIEYTRGEALRRRVNELHAALGESEREPEGGVRVGVLVRDHGEGRLEFSVFVMVPATSDVVFLGSLAVRATEDGEVEGAAASASEVGHALAAELGDDVTGVMTRYAFPAIDVVVIAQAKNVVLEDAEQVVRVVSRKQRREAKPRLFLRTLVIGGRSAREVVAAVRADAEARGVPFHMVRGHWKTYSKDAPLLGRAVGSFWWSPHFKGERKRGEVVKGYEVAP